MNSYNLNFLLLVLNGLTGCKLVCKPNTFIKHVSRGDPFVSLTRLTLTRTRLFSRRVTGCIKNFRLYLRGMMKEQ